MFRKTTILAALAACTLTATAAPAPAATYLHASTTTGNLLPLGTRLTTGLLGGSGGFTLTTSIGIITCTTGGLTATTTSVSGGATVTAALASGAGGLFFGAQTGTSTCSDSMPLLSYGPCAQSAAVPASLEATANAVGGQIVFSSVSLICKVNVGSGACVFDAHSAYGTYANPSHSVGVTGVQVTSTSPFPCFSSGTVAVAFGPVLVVGGPFNGQPVVVNTVP